MIAELGRNAKVNLAQGNLNSNLSGFSALERTRHDPPPSYKVTLIHKNNITLGQKFWSLPILNNDQ